MKQQNSLFGAISLRGRFKEIDQLHQRPLKAENRIPAFVDWVSEKVIANVFLLELSVILGPIAEHHVIDALERVACHVRMLDHDVQVLPEAAFPVLLAEVRAVEALIDE